MKPLVIGLDIDGVIVDLGKAILPLLSEACARPVSYQDLCSWNLGEALSIDEKTMENIWKQVLSDELLKDAPPIEGAIKGISEISKHEVWLVTSRPTYSRSVTLSWLKEHKIHYDNIIFNRRGDKLSVGPKFNIFVEDFIEEARVIAKAGIFTLLFDQPWNNASVLPKNCRRVYDWNDILLIIKDYEASQ
jgi:uncharacterized HAD superfamily protein